MNHYRNRFVVVALERHDVARGDPTNQSRILLAVSRDDTPESATAADWHYHSIDSKVNIWQRDCWVDYPGLELDEEAIYITGNMSRFSGDGGFFVAVRLWIVDKGVPGGLYDGGPVAVTVHDPYADDGVATTTVPALVHGAGGIDGGGSGGTYLVSYSGLTKGSKEYVQVVRVDSPLGIVSFKHEFVLAGNIDDLSPPRDLPDAPQAGTTTLIEVNDRRALDAVWRDNRLWLTATVVPGSGPDAGQTTAH